MHHAQIICLVKSPNVRCENIYFVNFYIRTDIKPNSLLPKWVNKRSNRNLLLSTSNIRSPNDSDYNVYKDATIFISIAAFRDPECPNTVLQVIENAKYPHRLRFGIFTQNNVSSDPDCSDFRKVLNCDKHRDYSHLFEHDKDNASNANNRWKQKYKSKQHPLCGRLWQIKTDRVHWKDGLGPTYGRYRTELFYDAEDYVLQMDSHTAFVQDWDVILIKMHKQLNNDYGVLSTYPKPLKSSSLWHYKVPPINHKSSMYVICSTQILTDKPTKSFKLKPARVIDNTGRPILSAFFAGGFSFQRGHRLENVPYDPWAAYLFDGEEISMAARMWTHGYDFYSPDADVAYHLYSPNNAKIRPVFWSFEWNKKWKIARESEYRINWMMKLHKKFHADKFDNFYDLREIDKYGLGDKRDVEDFWKFIRVDLDTFVSEDLCDLFKKGGMDEWRVPWKNNTEDPYHPVSAHRKK